MKLARRVVQWAARWAARSVWWPLAGRSLAGALAFVALAHVGRGAVARIDTPALMTSSFASSNATTAGDEPATTIALARASARPSAAPSSSCPRVKPTSPSWTENGKLILNLASAEDLRKLPRIGEKRAQSIMQLRKKLGRFKRVRDLLRIRGIGYRLLRKLKPLVVVDAPPKKET